MSPPSPSSPAGPRHRKGGGSEGEGAGGVEWKGLGGGQRFNPKMLLNAGFVIDCAIKA